MRICLLSRGQSQVPPSYSPADQGPSLFHITLRKRNNGLLCTMHLVDRKPLETLFSTADQITTPRGLEPSPILLLSSGKWFPVHACSQIGAFHCTASGNSSFILSCHHLPPNARRERHYCHCWRLTTERGGILAKKNCAKNIVITA